MEPGREVETPATAESTPLPIHAEANGATMGSGSNSAPQVESVPPYPSVSTIPTAETLLKAIATTDGPWFASRYAAEIGIPRDSLDEPLAELRLTGLIRVADWVKGLGQGFVPTPEGKAAATSSSEFERLTQAARLAAASADAAALSPAAKTEEQTKPEAEQAEESPSTDSELAVRPLLVVPGLLMANMLWFFVCAVISVRWGLAPFRLAKELHREVLTNFGAVSGVDLLDGEWWLLLTSCFVHIGFIHLIGNLLALAMMGPLAELLWGRTRLLLIYFISGLAGSALAMTLRPEAIVAGASGAIWGIQMSLFVWLFAFRRHLPPELASDWFRRLTVVFMLNAGVSFLPGVSWEGHLGGGVAGFLTAGLLNAARFGDRQRRISAWLLLALLPVLCVSGLAAAMDAKGMHGWQRLRQRLASEHERQAQKAAAEQERHEREERIHKLREAEHDFKANVEPRLNQLSTDAVSKISREAGVLLVMTKRSPDRIAALRAKVETLKKTADEVAALTTRDPTGFTRFDQIRARAKTFAAARANSFNSLLTALASPDPLKSESWPAWLAAHRDADHLWSELTAKEK